MLAFIRGTGAVTFLAQIAGWLFLSLDLSGTALLVSAAAMGVAQGVISDLRRNGSNPPSGPGSSSGS